MKFRQIAYALCLMTLSTINAEAKSVKNVASKKKVAFQKAYPQLMSKDVSSLPFYNATDTSIITLNGATTSAFQPLSFEDFVHDETGSVKASKSGNQFRLDEGAYLVMFTGTFEADLTDETSALGIFFDIALQLGQDVILINTDSRDPLASGFEPISISSTSQVIKVDKKTNLSVVTRCTTPSATVAVSTRSLTIIKLS